MCGIVGYIGNKPAEKILINGLKRLEYRGYDSAGIALADNDKVVSFKQKGKVSELENLLNSSDATTGIGHTRWATHGEPSQENAHPHTVGRITLVHNGIIENYQDIKNSLVNSPAFKSQTDSEALAALINSKLEPGVNVKTAIQESLKHVLGTFGVVIMDSRQPEVLFAARRGSPVLIGLSDKANYIASDATAILPYTDRVVYLEDNQLAVVKSEALDLYDLDDVLQSIEENKLEGDAELVQKNGFDHFMLKEIFEQPSVIENVLRGRLQPDGRVISSGLESIKEHLLTTERIIIVGCGTAYFAGLLGKYQLERLVDIPVSVEFGSEFRYRDAALDPSKTLIIFMSQSGETADTLASLEKAKQQGVPTFGLINAIGSSMTRLVDAGMYLHAGPEISVASTKAYSAMVTALLLLGLYIGELRGINRSLKQQVADNLFSIRNEIEEVLEEKNNIASVAKQISQYDKAFYLGRDALYPVAKEGALKMMEISYIDCQAYPSGEMKHGPIALVEPDLLTVALLPEDKTLFDKTISNIEEIKARSGPILTIGSKPLAIEGLAHITIPKTSQWIEPIITNVVLQLLAYFVSVERGNDVDQPRNLAKSVTVE